MNRRTSLALTGASPPSSCSPPTERATLRNPTSRPHQRISCRNESLDGSKLDPLWAHDATVILINPRDKIISVGWDAVKKQWEAAFASLAELKDTQADGPYIQVKGDVAWATGMVTIIGKTKAGVAFALNAPTWESDVFEKRGNAWLLVSHIALRVPQ